MKNKILLVLLNSDNYLTMSEIAEKTKSDIQLCNYHLKKMVTDNVIVCKQENDTKKYNVHEIVKTSVLYNNLFAIVTLAIPEFYEKLKSKEATIECIKQVLLNVLDDINFNEIDFNKTESH